MYIKLRDRAYKHWASGQDPILDVCIKPVGVSDWEPAEYIEREDTDYVSGI